MAVDEARRHELHERARRSFGDDSGDALMELLPPVGWADVATKQDLHTLKVELRALVVDSVRGSEHRLILWLVSTMFASTALSVGTAVGLAIAR